VWIFRWRGGPSVRPGGYRTWGDVKFQVSRRAFLFFLD
jgi:hypothetical protein